MRPVLISFIGPSGAGKSSCYQFAKDHLENLRFKVYRCDVAYPLRKIQLYAYLTFHRTHPGNPTEPINFMQDGRLLGLLAEHFEKDLGYTAQNTIRGVINSNKENLFSVINTDCRNNAYEALEKLGFIFVKLEVSSEVLNSRRAGRGDYTPFDLNLNVEQFGEIIADYTISNNGSLADLGSQVREVMSKITSQ